METLGEEGKVDESQALMKLVDSLRVKKADLERVRPFSFLASFKLSRSLCFLVPLRPHI